MTGDETGGAPGSPRVGVAVIAYNASATIEEVLARVPVAVAGGATAVHVSDDASVDDTAAVAVRWVAATGRDGVDVVRQPVNLGYGGNQVASFRWAIERRLEVVAVVHGDAQYPPELVPQLVAPILEGRADAVFGSRMLVTGGARRGNMPLVRRVGNRALSTVQNRLSGASLSEWHSGFRAFRVETLRQVDLAALPTGFDADTAMTLQLLRLGCAIEEIPIPTRYAGEVSYIKPFRTGAAILARTIAFRLRTSGRAPSPRAR